MKNTRVIALVAGIGCIASMAAFAADHRVPTAPTDYLGMKNPLKESAAVVERGEAVYRKCKKCHGAKGDGKGSGADGLEIKPTAFNAPAYLKGRADGQLFFIIDKGSLNTDMEAWGPGSESNLPKDDIWSVIAYMRKTFTQ